MRLNELATVAHSLAKEKGWWDGRVRHPDEIRMLFVTEICEAVEEVRVSTPPVYVRNLDGSIAPIETISWESFVRTDVDTAAGIETKTPIKPEGELIELADVVIRVGDWFGAHEINALERVQRYLDGGGYDLHDQIDFKGLGKLVTATFTYEDGNPLCAYAQMARSALSDTSFRETTLGALLVQIAAYAHQRNWDLDRAIDVKLRYNRERPYRHGNKTA